MGSRANDYGFVVQMHGYGFESWPLLIVYFYPSAFWVKSSVPGVTVSEAWLSPWKKCPPGHSCLGTTVPPDTGA